MAVLYQALLDITKQKNIFLNLSFQWESKIANYCAADRGGGLLFFLNFAPIDDVAVGLLVF